jgi:hypothetical protein
VVVAVATAAGLVEAEGAAAEVETAGAETTRGIAAVTVATTEDAQAAAPLAPEMVSAQVPLPSCSRATAQVEVVATAAREAAATTRDRRTVPATVSTTVDTEFDN